VVAAGGSVPARAFPRRDAIALATNERPSAGVVIGMLATATLESCGYVPDESRPCALVKIHLSASAPTY
jgi:hypothetical protein